MNPPFGTKNNEGIDMKLLNAAFYVTYCDYIYRLAKEKSFLYIKNLQQNIF